MKVSVYLKIKFRAFGITFHNYEKKWEKSFVLSAEDGKFSKVRPGQSGTVVDFDQRGVRLLVAVE